MCFNLFFCCRLVADALAEPVGEAKSDIRIPSNQKNMEQGRGKYVICVLAMIINVSGGNGNYLVAARMQPCRRGAIFSSFKYISAASTTKITLLLFLHVGDVVSESMC